MPGSRKGSSPRVPRPRVAAGGGSRKPPARRSGAGAAAGKRVVAGAGPTGSPERKAAARPRSAAARTLTVVQVRSAIACPRRQRRILRSLGLRGPNDRRQLPDRPSVRGMVAALRHLVRIEDEGAERGSQP
jgi:large subunit ribosomal protein L30